MSKDAEYRSKALECVEAAERAHDLHERLELLKMAQAWVKLAEHTWGEPRPLGTSRGGPGYPAAAKGSER